MRGLAYQIASRLRFYLLACGDNAAEVTRPDAPEHSGIYGFAHGCYTVDATRPRSSDTRWLEAVGTEGFAFTARSASEGARFTMQPSDLGTYLLYDREGSYFVAEEGRLSRKARLDSDIGLLDDSYVSPAEWTLSSLLRTMPIASRWFTTKAGSTWALTRLSRM